MASRSATWPLSKQLMRPDVTFLGPAGSPGTRSRHGFDRQIRRWLGSGQRREDAWVVSDPDAPASRALLAEARSNDAQRVRTFIANAIQERRR